MALIQCSQCHQPISTGVSTCPLCGHLNEQQLPPDTTTEVTKPVVAKEVSWPLLLGIIFLPYIFVWFILRKGYRFTTQAIALGWLAFMLYTLTIEFYEIVNLQISAKQEVIINK